MPNHKRYCGGGRELIRGLLEKPTTALQNLGARLRPHPVALAAESKLKL
jgi:hypothetical protein